MEVNGYRQFRHSLDQVPKQIGQKKIYGGVGNKRIGIGKS